MAKTTVVHAVDMLHYLPLFIAHKLYLQQLDFELALAPTGDKEAFERLMSTLTINKSTDFCLCDPMMVNLAKSFDATSGDRPVVIGQVIQKVPFWAVDHKNDNFAKEEQFSSFSQIFSYPKPNTGYVFGKLIYERARTRNKALQFRPEKQIDAELGHYLASPGAVVLEADILKITAFKEETSNEVVFSFPLASEYQQFCFTALLTRRAYLASPAGKARAHELVTALQNAAFIIYNVPELALQTAVEHFGQRGFKEEVIASALAALRNQEIFSPSLVVSRRAWRNSINIQVRADPDFQSPSFGKFVVCGVAKDANKLIRKKGNGSGWKWLRVPGDWTNFLWLGFLVFLLLYPIFLVDLNKIRSEVIRWPAPKWVLLHFPATILINAYLWFGRSLVDSPRRKIQVDIPVWLTYLGVEVFALLDLISPGS